MSHAAIRTEWKPFIAERTTPLLTMTIVDETGTPIPSLSALTITLHAAGTVINGRNKVNVLSSFTDGTLTWRFAAEDTAILEPSRGHEVHTLLIEWAWDSSQRHGKHEVVHIVRNLALVP